MAADYPNAIKTFTVKQDGVDDVMADHVNALQYEITAIETELGTNPKGDKADVKTRLDAIENSIDDLAGVNRTTETVKGNADSLAAHSGNNVLDHPDGSVTDAKIGNRTADQTQAPTGSTGTITQLFSWITNRIKAILGTTNWYDTPDITIATLAQHKSRHATGGADALTPSDIGAETPAGAQAKVDAHNQTRKAHGIGYAASITAAGWYRIASNGPVAAGGTGGSRAFAKFTVQDKTWRQHKAIVFYAGYHYGDQPTIVLLGNSKYSGTGRITKIRLIEGSEYEGAAVEVYIDGSATVEFQITENFQDPGWIAVNWEAGSVPTGFTVTQLDLDTIGDPVFAIACDNQNNMFYVARNGETYVKNNKIWHAGNDGPGSGLDADLIDGLHASAFTRARVGGQNIWVQSTAPTAIAVGDIWIDTSS